MAVYKKSRLQYNKTMVDQSEKPVPWFIRRATEALLVIVIFLGGFLTREYMPDSGERRDATVPATPSVPANNVMPTVSRDAKIPSAVLPAVPTVVPSLPEVPELAIAQRRLIPVTILMAGQVDIDPQGVHTLSAPLPGRIDRLYYASPGLFVDEGEALIQLFCPETVAAQTALIDAVRSHKEAGEGGSGFFGKLKTRQIEEAREILQRMGLAPGQIESVEQSTRARDHLLFRAPVSGHLMTLPVHSGQYVARGDPLCTVVDLTTVRIVLAASQQDLQWLRYGQTVRFVPEGREDLAWGGWIVSLATTADAATRRWQVFVHAMNSQDLLRPGMAVQASVTCTAAGVGRVVDPNRADRWMCPVHPQVISDSRGTCPQCQRALVSGSSQGYVNLSAEADMPLVIPGQAIYHRGGQSLVTVQEPNDSFLERPLGVTERIGDYVIVENGLREGERVVIHRNRPAGDSL
jgi:Cu(I)/Ag(I) efflux system membrane fusion protein